RRGKPLPVEANRKLHLARRVRRFHLAEIRVLGYAVKAVLADRVVVVGAIEDVEELRSHYYCSSLRQRHAETLLHGHVVGEVIRSLELIATAVAQARRSHSSGEQRRGRVEAATAIRG